MSDSIRNLRQFVIGPAGSEVAAILVMFVLVGLVTAPLALFADSPVTANGPAPVNPCEGQIIANATTQVASQLQIAGTTGDDRSLDMFTGRDGGAEERVSAPLGVENGTLPPKLCLGTVLSDLVRTDGQSIPPDQVTSWATTGNAGLRVFIHVEVSPRYGGVTPAGGYTGTVSMSDQRATGGNVPVDIHIEYPRLWRASMVCIVAAWFGFFWAWLIHLTRADIPNAGRFWLYVILQLAVLTIVCFPVLNAQILTNPDWSGDLSKYIALASLAGGGALATTPTLRALVDRAAIFMPGATVTPPDAPAPAAPEASPASTPQGGDGDTLGTPADGDGGVSTPAGGGSLTTPAGSDGSALTTPAGGDGGSMSTPSGSDSGSVPTPAGSDGSALTAPAGSDAGALTAPAGSDDDSASTPAGGNGAASITSASSDSGSTTLTTPAGGDGSTLPTPADTDSGSTLPTPAGSDSTLSTADGSDSGSLANGPQGGDGGDGALTAPTTAPASSASPGSPADPQDPSNPPGN